MYKTCYQRLAVKSIFGMCGGGGCHNWGNTLSIYFMFRPFEQFIIWGTINFYNGCRVLHVIYDLVSKTCYL